MNKQEQQTAQRLADSGLFDWTGNVYALCGPHDMPGPQKRRHLWPNNPNYVALFNRQKAKMFGPWPTADESESILAEMRLQVFWLSIQKAYAFAPLVCRSERTEPFNAEFDRVLFDGIAVGQRTLANNAALAWLAENKPVETKAAIERWRK